MKTYKFAMLTGAALAVLGLSNGALAATVTTQTRLTPNPSPTANIVDFRVFDTNGDGELSQVEVGEKLFYTFDRDGNQLIDSTEYDRPMVLAFAPMTKETVQYLDYNNDGRPDHTQISQEAFMAKTGLSRFDPRGEGLSAAKFVEKPFNKMDRDNSGQIDIREWKQSYGAIKKPLSQNETFRYNN